MELVNAGSPLLCLVREPCGHADLPLFGSRGTTISLLRLTGDFHQFFRYS